MGWIGTDWSKDGMDMEGRKEGRNTPAPSEEEKELDYRTRKTERPLFNVSFVVFLERWAFGEGGLCSAFFA